MWCTGLIAPRHVGSSRIRAQTHVPCIGRRILNHCTTREVPRDCCLEERKDKFTCPQCKSVRLLSEEARKTGSPNSKHKYLKGKKRQNYQGYQVFISLFMVGKKNHTNSLTQPPYLQKSPMLSDTSITKIRDNIVSGVQVCRKIFRVYYSGDQNL